MHNLTEQTTNITIILNNNINGNDNSNDDDNKNDKDNNSTSNNTLGGFWLLMVRVLDVFEHRLAGLHTLS